MLKEETNKSYNLYRLYREDILQNARAAISAKNGKTSILILNPCSNTSFVCSSFSNVLSSVYPQLLPNFQMLSKNQMRLGHVQYVEVESVNYNKIIVANMICHDGSKSKTNPRPFHYVGLSFCLTDIRNYCNRFVSSKDGVGIDIYCPKLGSLSSGANWLFIQDIFHDVFGTTSLRFFIKP